MSNSVMQNPRLVELLVQRAVDGLNSSERAELKQLLTAEKYTDAGRFEYTAASLLLAGDVENHVPEEMPDSLRERLYAQADTVAASMPPPARQSASQPRVISIAGRSRTTTATPAVSTPEIAKPAPSRKSSSWQSKVGWFAAAASVLIAVAGWWPRLQTGGDPTIEVPIASTLEQERQQLLAQQGVLTRTWQTTQDPAASGVTGDVVWDPRTQNGYLRFRGLQANNADELQYQLWIFDGTRDERYPVDGGVFDIPPGQGEVIIPITAKLEIRNPAMFAVTIEKPGGSVVSSRDRIVVLAPVAAG
ncbi:anti-sigma factor [Steroidobacter sp.]|uniref:anti-sigma factor n=1 Tax=Steroidobacter sp. TaxID=1978227 RepID=UPI001A396515|nr:anti-sigma factor [Steroidobacter sp.]MBL8267698.1 anti-sigma factor [Steroidobacter sp.]